MTDTAGWAELLRGGRLPLLALIWLGVWLTASDSLVTATLLPSVGAELGGYAWFAWMVAGFMLGAILAGASAGLLSERLGLRLASTLGGGLFAAGCAVSAAAPDMPVFVAGRVLQGVGGGWVQGLAMVAIARLFPPRHIARVFASVAAIWGVATVLGPLIGGLFADGSGWRTVFWLFAAQAGLFTIKPASFNHLVPHRRHNSNAPAAEARASCRAFRVISPPVIRSCINALVVHVRDIRGAICTVPHRGFTPRTDPP